MVEVIDLSWLTLPVGLLVLIFTGMMVWCWVFQRTYKPIQGKLGYKPFFSVIVPALDEELFIGKVVEDILSQDYGNFELLVMANNCCDDTANEARKAAGKDSRVRVIEYSTSHKGKAAALNKGVALSTGEIIVAHDSDVRLDKDYLSKLVRYFSDMSVNAVQPRYEVYNKNFSLLTMLQHIEFLCFSQIFNKGKYALGGSALAGGVNFVIRRSVLKKVGGWLDHLTEDYKLVDTLLKEGYRVTYADDITARFQAVVSWDDMLKQRSRWIRGHLSITFESLLSKPSSFFDLLFKISPIYNSLIFLLFILFYVYLFFLYGQVTYFYFPVWVWLLGIAVHQIMVMEVCIKQKYWRGVILSPLFLVYTLHWMLVLFRIPFVSSWKDTRARRVIC